MPFSVSGCIIGNLHVCEQARSARSVCNNALENLCVIIIISVSIRTSLDSYFCLICLALYFRSRVRICYDSLYVHILLFIVIFIPSLSEYPHECSAILWLIVRVYVRFLIHFFLSSLLMPLSVFGYIVTDCPCIGSSLDLHFSLCLYLSQYPRILPLILCSTSLYMCFPLTFCLWMCTPVSEYIIIYSWRICTCLEPCFCLSFSMIVYVCVRLYRHWLYVYRYVCYSAICLSLDTSVFVNVRVYYWEFTCMWRSEFSSVSV